MNFLSSLTGNSKINLVDPAEASANRMGQITPAQNEWLNTAAFGGTGLIRVILPLVVSLFLCSFLGIFSFSGLSDVWYVLLFLVLVFLIVGWQVVPGFIGGMQRASKLRTDRQSGLIRQAVGELGFGKDGYVAQAGDRQLFIPSSKDTCGLLPGVRYNFYYLEESGIVLSAEQLGGVSAASMRTSLNRILAEANKFASEDLSANQLGEISEGQRGRLVRKSLGGLGLALFMVVVALGVGAALFFSGESIDWMAILIFLGVFGIFGAIGALSMFNSFMDLNAMPEMEEGRGGKHTERRRSGKSSRTVYFYDIGNMKFQVSQRAYLALIENVQYRAYYAPRSKTLLSLEVTGLPELT